MKAMRIGVLPNLPLAKLRARAARDHATARGTQHLNRVRAALHKLDGEIEALKARLAALEGRVAELEREFAAELRRAIVLRELRKLSGIGPALAQEIVSTCFDGTLESLAEAGSRVQGVGERRQRAIREWIDHMKSRLPSLMEEGSPEREEFSAVFARKRERIERRKARLEAEIRGLTTLRKRAEEGIRWLAVVTPDHFLRAYRGDGDARALVERYLIGLFPEWEEPPDWFAELMGRFG